MVFECCYLPVFPNHPPSPHAHSFLVTWPVLLPALRPFVRKLPNPPLLAGPVLSVSPLELPSFFFLQFSFSSAFFLYLHIPQVYTPRGSLLFFILTYTVASRVLLKPLGGEREREKRWSWLHPRLGRVSNVVRRGSWESTVAPTQCCQPTLALPATV